MVASLRRSEERLGPDQLHGLSAAKQRVSHAAGRRSFAQAACTCRKVPPVAARARPAAVPARQCSRHPAPEHQPVVHHEALAGPGGWVAAAPELQYPSRCWMGAARRQLAMCPDFCEVPLGSQKGEMFDDHGDDY